MTTWLQHVKKVRASGSTSFKESLKRASASWKKTKGKATKSSGKRGKKAKAEDTISTEEQEAPAPKKKRRRKAKRSTPRIPAGAFKSVDSRNL